MFLNLSYAPGKSTRDYGARNRNIEKTKINYAGVIKETLVCLKKTRVIIIKKCIIIQNNITKIFRHIKTIKISDETHPIQEINRASHMILI